MEKIELKKKHKESLTEIFQNKNLQMTFVDKNYQQVTSSFKCRDFLGDFLWSKIANKPVSIYGFSYNFEDFPYDVDCFRMSLEFPDNETKEIFLKNLNFLHEKEKKAEVSEFCLLETQDPLTLVIEANPIWQSTVWKTSLYSFYLKIMCYPSLKEIQSPENNYLFFLTEEKENILLSKVKTKEYFHRDSYSFNHDYAGFVSLIRAKEFGFFTSSKYKSFQDEYNFIFGT